MSKPYDRPATNPGGMECLECGVIFIGEEWHGRCALCDDKPWNHFLGELETWCCELPDRSSPDDAPEMMLIDRQELVMLAVKVRDFTIRQTEARATAAEATVTALEEALKAAEEALEVSQARRKAMGTALSKIAGDHMGPAEQSDLAFKTLTDWSEK